MHCRAFFSLRVEMTPIEAVFNGFFFFVSRLGFVTPEATTRFDRIGIQPLLVQNSG